MRTHTGERPYPCTLCPFSATQATALRAHMRTHTGERPFPCQVEGCSFAGKNPHHLKTHMVTHTGERAFSCVHPGCEYAATTAGALVIHQRTHSGERPHVCDAPLCDYQSAQAGNLAQHKLRMHSDKGVQRQKRKENAVMTFLAQHFTVEREVNIEFACGMEGTGRRERARARLDGVIEFPERNLRVIVEVDEEQHKYYSSSVACDNARMMRVCEAVLAGGNTANLLWVRYNPDAYTVAGVAAAARTHTRTQKSERLDALLQLVQTHTPTMPMQVIYLFYDQDSDGRPCILRDAEYDAAFAAHVL